MHPDIIIIIIIIIFGRSATWDLTVVHTLAASYVAQSAVQAEKAAEIAAERKSAKYSGLSSSRIFIPVAVESLGPLADDAHRFITKIGRRMTFSTADPRETAFLYQRISVAIQSYNAVCLANTFIIDPSKSFRTLSSPSSSSSSSS